MSEKTRVANTSSNFKTWNIVTNREINKRARVGYQDEISRKIYCSIDTDHNDPLHKFCGNEKGIFNLEFSTDGKYLVAACEKGSILLFDAANQKLTHTIDNAHKKCVNNIRFLDDITFASCSDDTITKIWDLRKLKQPTQMLRGQTYSVKNVEYIEKDNIIITSSLDGTVNVWNRRNFTGPVAYYESSLVLSGITRCTLTPDKEKLILCTTGGYMIIVHDLDITELCSDLETFNPSIYRLMQQTQQLLPCSTMNNHLFNQDRMHNRLEIVDDFPLGAEILTSIQVHPMGWCAVTRSINVAETDEWTTVHDIQTRDPSEYCDAYKYVEEELDPEHETHLRPTDIWMGSATLQSLSYYRAQQVLYPMDSDQSSMNIIHSGLIGANTYDRYFRTIPEERNRVFMTIPRLTHYITEEVVAKGFIKELCFSNDGRVICSPYNNGVRLLGFNEKIEELSYCVPDSAKLLHQICVMDNYHSNAVLSSKFNPLHYQLVSGSFNSEIVWYKPLL